MTDPKQSWEEVGAKFSGLGHKLRQHLEAERAQSGADAPKDAGRDVKAVLEKLAESIDDAFDALGKAAKDPEVRAEATDVGRTLASAIGTSFEQLGDEVRRIMERRKGTGGTEPGSGAGEGDGMSGA